MSWCRVKREGVEGWGVVWRGKGEMGCEMRSEVRKGGKEKEKERIEEETMTTLCHFLKAFICFWLFCCE